MRFIFLLCALLISTVSFPQIRKYSGNLSIKTKGGTVVSKNTDQLVITINSTNKTISLYNVNEDSYIKLSYISSQPIQTEIGQQEVFELTRQFSKTNPTGAEAASLGYTDGKYVFTLISFSGVNVYFPNLDLIKK